MIRTHIPLLAFDPTRLYLLANFIDLFDRVREDIPSATGLDLNLVDSIHETLDDNRGTHVIITLHQLRADGLLAFDLDDEQWRFASTDTETAARLDVRAALNALAIVDLQQLADRLNSSAVPNYANAGLLNTLAYDGFLESLLVSLTDYRGPRP